MIATNRRRLVRSMGNDTEWAASILRILASAVAVVVHSACESLPLGLEGGAAAGADASVDAASSDGLVVKPDEQAAGASDARDAWAEEAGAQDASDEFDAEARAIGHTQGPVEDSSVRSEIDALQRDAASGPAEGGSLTDQLVPPYDARPDIDVGDANARSAGSDAAPPCVPASCGTRSWACWPMPNAPVTPLPHPAKYTVMADENVIRDDVTCLLWQSLAPTTTAYTWANAQAFCTQTKYFGGVGWRLPTRIELISIVDYSRKSPSIVVSVFPSTQLSPPYWVWSPFGALPNNSYTISFNEGAVSYAEQSTMFLARCVRGNGESGELPVAAPPDHYRVGLDQVVDNYTGLTWQRADSRSLSPSELPRQEADGYCRTLSAGGHTWRLPSVKELATLVDESRLGLAMPAVDPQAFPATVARAYWSSTNFGQTAWTVDFADGAHRHDTNLAFARCVATN